jgi:hypothetical protein
MIELIIYQLHIVAALYAFTKNWQRRRFSYAILSILIILLVFSIGWALTTPIAQLIMPLKWNTIYFKRDTLSLILLFIPEVFFFYKFFVKDNAPINNTEAETALEENDGIFL